jgi:bacillopeptidase F
MRILATLCGGVLAACSAAHAGLISPDLETILDESLESDTISTLVYMVDQVPLDELTDDLDAQRARLATRHRVVVTALRDLAAATQGELLADLDGRKAAGHVADYRAFWIANVVRVDAKPQAVRAIAKRPDVWMIYPNYEIELIEPVEWRDPEPPGGPRTPEPGVEAVRAPEVWAMGIDGTGVLVANIDTGVDGNHPALGTRWIGDTLPYVGHPEWAWYDPLFIDDEPYDQQGHGTHTMGSVCGGAPGDQIGVAPGAKWMAAAPIDRVDIPTTVEDAIESFQWMVDPDGDPETNWDVPDVCSNSWGLTTGHGYPPCDETFWSYLDACEAAGIVILFSAGNEGSSGLRRPADRATDDYRTLAVAAVDANDPSWPIAGFSSRGPTFCTPDGSAAIKPDIAAPGVNVRSSLPGGGYGSLSGTSMASPHVNGVVALIRQANPDLSVEEVKQIMYDTAYDLGAPGEDNSYGWGMVDAYESVVMALDFVGLTFTLPDGHPEFIDPNGGTTIEVIVSGSMVPPEPGTGMLHYSTGGEFTSIPMDSIGINDYNAVFPSFECAAEVHYYFSAETVDGDVATFPFGAPDNNFSRLAYSGVNVGFEDDFESDLGWTVEDTGGLTTGTWQRGEPQGGGDRGDPAADADGSGQCYVTGIADGDNDIDDGTTTLTSPVMDASDPDAMITYYRWYSNTFGDNPMADTFVVDVSDDGGSTWTNLETVGPGGSEVSGGWYHKEFRVDEIPGIENNDQFRIRFIASDLGGGSVVEAGVDGVTIESLYCEDLGTPGDVNGDGSVNVIDLLLLLDAWGPCPGCPEDVNGDGIVNVIDMLLLLDNWG